MTVETDFRALLAAHAPLVALVSTRIALNAVPEGSAFPLVVFAAQHTPTLGLDGTLLAHQATLDVQCWAETAAAADAVADAVVAAAALAPAARGCALLGRTTTHDPEVGKDGTTLSFDWWAV